MTSVTYWKNAATSEGRPRIKGPHPNLGRSKKWFHPESQKKHGPDNTLISDFWPPGTQNKPIFLSHPVWDNLLWQAPKTNTPSCFLQKSPKKHIHPPSYLWVQVYLTINCQSCLLFTTHCIFFFNLREKNYHPILVQIWNTENVQWSYFPMNSSTKGKGLNKIWRLPSPNCHSQIKCKGGAGRNALTVCMA